MLQHHDAISGTAMQYVASAYSHKLFVGFNESRNEMANDIAKKLHKMANVEIKAGELKQCIDFMQNDTVINCPIDQDSKSKEFLVVVYNSNT
jgi:hypothetical protein